MRSKLVNAQSEMNGYEKICLRRDLSAVGPWRKRCPVTLDCDGMDSIPAIPEARNVPLLLCHEAGMSGLMKLACQNGPIFAAR